MKQDPEIDPNWFNYSLNMPHVIQTSKMLLGGVSQNSCNMHAYDLPDISALTLWRCVPLGIVHKSLMPMLQLLHVYGFQYTVEKKNSPTSDKVLANQKY